MSASWRTGRLVGLLAVSLVGLQPLVAQDRVNSTDRERFLTITRNLERNPLEPRLRSEGSWAIQWLADDPDISVTLCVEPLGGKSNYRYAPEIIVQYMLSMAAWLIQHPEAKTDPNAQQLAGVEGALNAYRSILRTKPEAQSSRLDSLIEKQSLGQLPTSVQQAWLDCQSKGASQPA